MRRVPNNDVFHSAAWNPNKDRVTHATFDCSARRKFRDCQCAPVSKVPVAQRLYFCCTACGFRHDFRANSVSALYVVILRDFYFILRGKSGRCRNIRGGFTSPYGCWNARCVLINVLNPLDQRLYARDKPLMA